MNSFDDRKKGYESKFVLDQEQEFKAQARRNKLLGHWAAELLGKSGDDVKAYALEVIKSDFEEAGDDDVHRKVMADLEAARVSVSAEALRKKMDELLSEARRQIAEES